MTTSQDRSNVTRYEQQILDTSSIGVLITRISDGTILYANKAIADLLGRTDAGSIIGLPIPDFYWDQKDRAALLDRFRAEGSIANSETRARRSDGSMIWVSIALQPFEFEGEHVLLSEITNITERKQAEEKLKESQQLLESFLNNFPDGAWVKDLDGHFVLANRYVVENIYGTTENNVIGKTVHDTFPKDVADFLWGSEKRLLETGETLAVEEYVPQADGKVYNKITTKFPLYDARGNINGLGGVLIDITERKQVEDAVKESQQRLSLLIDSSPLAFIEWNTNFEVVSWNPAAERIFGYTAAEAKGKHARFIIPPEFHMYVDQVWEGLITQSGGTRATNANVTKGGQTITCEWYNTPLVGTDGKVLGASSLVEDITERKQTEDAVKESQQKLSLLIDSSPLAFIEWNTNFEVVSWNPAAERIFGYTAAEAQGKHARFIIPPEFHMYVDQVWEGLITQTGGTRATNANVTKSGQAITCEWYNTPLAGTDGKVLGVSSLVEDITERKQAEEELQRIQIIAETVPDFIAIASPDRSVLYVNSAGLEITGKTAEEVSKGIKIEDFQPTLSPEVLKIVETEGIWKGESEFIRKDGSLFPVSQVIATSKDSQGQVQYITTLARDITESKEAEEKLLQMQSAVEQTGDGIAMADLGGNVLYSNPAWARMHGYAADEIIGKHLSIFHTSEQLEKEVIPFNSKVMSDGISTSEIGHARKDGSIFPTLMTTVVQKDENGNPVGLIGTIRDITERKQAEDLLQQSEANLASALRVAQMGYWEFDVPTQIFTFNDQYYSLLGTTAEKAGGYQMSAQKFATEYVPPEDAGIVQASIIGAIEATDPNFQTQIETRNLRADGTSISTIVWFRIRKDSQGQTVKLYGVSQDITERKRLEREIQEAFERRGFQVQVSTEISQEIAGATKLSDLFERVVTLTKERFGYYHTQLLRYDITQDAVVLVTGYGETGQKMLAGGHRMSLGSGLIGTAAATGQTIMRPTLTEDPDWKPNPLLSDTKGEIAVPIKLGDQILGVLDIQSDQAGSLSEDDRLLLEGLCGQVAVAIEQTRLRQEMNERLDEVNRLYQSMSQEGWKTYRENENLPKGFIFDQEGTRPVEDETLADDQSANIPMRVLGGEIVGMLSIANNPNQPTTPEDENFLQQVSDQIALALEGARLSAQTQSVLAQTEKMFDASFRLTQVTDLQELVEYVTKTVNIPVVNRAILSTYSYDANDNLDSVTVVANWWSGVGHAVAPVGTRYSQEVIKVMPMLASQTPLFFDDVYIDEHVDAVTREIVKRQGIRSIAVLPLRIGALQMGAFALESEEPHTFTQEEMRLFTALAPQIATVMENRRQYQEAQNKAERETMLNVISQKIQSATTVDAVLQIAARELGHALGAPMTIAQLSMKDKEK